MSEYSRAQSLDTVTQLPVLINGDGGSRVPVAQPDHPHEAHIRSGWQPLVPVADTATPALTELAHAPIHKTLLGT